MLSGPACKSEKKFHHFDMSPPGSISVSNDRNYFNLDRYHLFNYCSLLWQFINNLHSNNCESRHNDMGHNEMEGE